jgi:uncharacterized membrane protein YdjX (TVP38/TMEM64 family)/Fe-S oxidoreductase
MEHSQSVEAFLNACTACTGCGSCATSCPFLQTYGTPDTIITGHPQDVFLCTNCGGCVSRCPSGLSPAEALFQTKCDMIRAGNIPDTVRQALKGARGFADTGHHFPFVSYSTTDTVFWPGCGLAGMYPAIARKIIGILSEHLGTKVGMVLDCCYDPVYQFGDVTKAGTAIKSIRARLKSHNISRVITGCPNCQKIFSLFFKDIKVEHILEVLPRDAFEFELEKHIYLHHPCPSFQSETIRQTTRELFDRQDQTIVDSRESLCCGYGGGLATLSPPLAEQFTDRIIQASGENPIVTYCTGCKDRFMPKGKSSFHILEFLPGITPLQKPVSSLRRWINRFLLSFSQQIKSKKFLAGLAVVILTVLSVYLGNQGYVSAELIIDTLKSHPVAAPLIFIGIYAIAPALFLFSIPLTLVAGFLWGPFWGVVLSITSATAGACVSFLLARYLFGGTVKAGFSPERWQWLQTQVERHGWKAVAFTRLIPVFPFNVLNYLFGITPIPFRHYLWSTFVFMLPACVAFVAFGSSLGELILKGSIKGLIIGILIAASALLLPLAFKPYFRKIMSTQNSSIEKDSEERTLQQ